MQHKTFLKETKSVTEKPNETERKKVVEPMINSFICCYSVCVRVPTEQIHIRSEEIWWFEYG